MDRRVAAGAREGARPVPRVHGQARAVAGHRRCRGGQVQEAVRRAVQVPPDRSERRQEEVTDRVWCGSLSLSGLVAASSRDSCGFCGVLKSAQLVGERDSTET